jgi:hypothetical protein
MIEEWIDAIGYDGLYEVSNLGRVKSVGRLVNNGGSGRWVKEKVLNLCKDKKGGRLTVTLSINNVKTRMAVSTLVYFSFNKDKNYLDNTYCVMHKDKIQDNNRLDNLVLTKISVSHSINFKKGLLPHLAENNKILAQKRKLK